MARSLAAYAIAAILCLAAGCGGGDSEVAAPAWNHNPDDTELGPTAWGQLDESFEQCATGDEQSPVDIAEPVPADLPPLEFDYPLGLLTVVNTGHVIEVTPSDSNDLTLTIEDTEYRLVQFHFHAPAEHSLDGQAYDAELHLVHESDDGELAVVGLVLERSALGIPLFDAVLETASEVVGEEVQLAEVRSPLEFLLVLDAATTVVTTYNTYPGSLTTPGCTEGVRWIVLPETVGVTTGAVDRLHELIAGFPDYDGYENNNRPLQPLNAREIESNS